MQPEETAESGPSRRRMDDALRLANQLDALCEEMSPWAREWALRFLMAKYPHPRGSDERHEDR